MALPLTMAVFAAQGTRPLSDLQETWVILAAGLIGEEPPKPMPETEGEGREFVMRAVSRFLRRGQSFVAHELFVSTVTLFAVSGSHHRCRRAGCRPVRSRRLVSDVWCLWRNSTATAPTPSARDCAFHFVAPVRR